MEASKLKYRLNLLIENADFQNKDFSHVPDDMQHLFSNPGTLTDEGISDLSDIKTVLDSIPNLDLEENSIVKQRIEHLLEHADFDITKYNDTTTLSKQ